MHSHVSAWILVSRAAGLRRTRETARSLPCLTVLCIYSEVWGNPSAPFPRYLYVNSRAWPRDCIISDPMQPPPIAEEIDLHVFDLKTMKEVKRALRAHRAYTPNEECFFIFLDVSRDFVARCVVMWVGRVLTLRLGGPRGCRCGTACASRADLCAGNSSVL